jgi:hypothetical protein
MFRLLKQLWRWFTTPVHQSAGWCAACARWSKHRWYIRKAGMLCINCINQAPIDLPQLKPCEHCGAMVQKRAFEHACSKFLCLYCYDSQSWRID